MGVDLYLNPPTKDSPVKDFLKEIWTSSFWLPRKHNIRPSQHDQRRFFNEEALELIEASVVNSVEGGAEEHICEEAFDAIYTALGLVQAHGISYEGFERYAREKLAENDAKTPENGYANVNGKVRKVKP